MSQQFEAHASQDEIDEIFRQLTSNERDGASQPHIPHHKSRSPKRHGHKHRHHRSWSEEPSKRHKPNSIEKLQANGGNWVAWRQRVEAAFVYDKILHILKPPAADGHHRQSHIDMGIIILKENVVDELLYTIDPPHGSQDGRTPAAAMLRLEQQFGGVQTALVTMHRSNLVNLMQGRNEDVSAFVRRAQSYHNALLAAGGKFDTDAFLDCVKGGVLDKFQMIVQFFENSPDRSNVMVLAGRLVAEECRLERSSSRHSGGAQGVAGATVSMGGQQRWSSGTAPDRGQQQQLGAPRPGGRGAGREGGTLVRNDKAYADSAKDAICWNCGAKGHRVGNCPLPLKKPFEHRPAGFMTLADKRRMGLPLGGPPAGPAPPAAQQGNMRA
jgi:hypothetical protein